MARFKDFDAARAENAAEPLSFRLGGMDFETTPMVPAGLLLDMSRAVAGGDDTDAYRAFSAFFEAIVPVERAEDFAAALRRVDIATMLELVAWLVEESTGRPLSSPSSSPPQPATAGQSSKPVSLATVTETRSA